MIPILSRAPQFRRRPVARVLLDMLKNFASG
jgi:hypothetical protein